MLTAPSWRTSISGAGAARAVAALSAVTMAANFMSMVLKWFGRCTVTNVLESSEAVLRVKDRLGREAYLIYIPWAEWSLVRATRLAYYSARHRATCGMHDIVYERASGKVQSKERRLSCIPARHITSSYPFSPVFGDDEGKS
jgi:hypothetical protein